MATEEFRIRKITDRQLVDAFQQVAASCSFSMISFDIPIVRHTQNEDRSPTWFKNAVLEKALQMDSMLIPSLSMTLGNNQRLAVTRDLSNPATDRLTLTLPDHIPPDGIDAAFSTLRTVRTVFAEITAPLWNLDALGADVKAHYEAREQYLARQEREVSSFFTKMADFNRQLMEEHRQKMDSLESDFTDRQRKLEEQHERRMTELNQRDAEFEKQKAEFDLREARGARRQLRTSQKEELQKLIEKFALTPDTQSKRNPVWYAAVLTTVTLAGITLYLMFGQSVVDQQGSLNSVLIVRQITFSLATVGFLWFFIHWSNRWFQRHADEELRLKRLSLDLDRASWVFEMILDWQKETKQEFPAELLKQLAKNLYSADGVGDDDVTKADLLASLLGAAANLKIKGGGSELEFDRKSLKEIDKSR